MLRACPRRVYRRCLQCRCFPWQRARGRSVLADGHEDDDQAQLVEVMLPRLSDDSASEDSDVAPAGLAGVGGRQGGSAPTGDGASLGGGRVRVALAATTAANVGAGHAGGFMGGSRVRGAGESAATVRFHVQPGRGDAAPPGWDDAVALAGLGGMDGGDRVARGHGRGGGRGRAPTEYMELAGRPEDYTVVEAAILMSLLPHEKWGFHHIRDEDNGEGDNECRVCLNDYEQDEDIVRLPCMHYAHTQCMEQWLVRNPRCPVCRNNVREALQNDELFG
mmetsp:Transcript_72314/g.200595  ORF Transcript_72314/g.200595 Transcript_72314/m.200595 type:complete len:277 (-) Transcript_72314:123-953(-)